jgi:hypothetical protein
MNRLVISRPALLATGRWAALFNADSGDNRVRCTPRSAQDHDAAKILKGMSDYRVALYWSTHLFVSRA